MIYILSHSWWEENSYIYLDGPKVDNFKLFCDKFIGTAARSALQKMSKQDLMLPIGWRDIVEELALLLKNEEFQIVQFEEANYWGNDVIDIRDLKNNFEENSHLLSGETLKQISDYNWKE